MFAWQVIGAYDYAPVTEHTRIRLERWMINEPDQAAFNTTWDRIQATAATQNIASVWFLYASDEQQVGLVTITNDKNASELKANSALHDVPLLETNLGSIVERLDVQKVFDHTSWVLTLWLPQAEDSTQALWPNSPPLPQPGA